jgi:hypothetical protein
MKPKEPEEPQVITECPDSDSCLHLQEERGVCERQEISLDENCKNNVKTGIARLPQ